MRSMEISLNCFKYNIILLNILGLYPFGTWTTLYKLYSNFVYIVFITIVPLLPVVKLAIDKETNVEVMAQDLYMATQLIVIIFKVLPLRDISDKVKRSIFILNDDTFNNYLPEQSFILEEIVVNCKWIFGVYCMTCFSAYWFWTLKPLVTKDFPFKIWLPFDSENTLVWVSVYAFIAIGGAYGCMTNMTLDTLIPLLIYHAAGQLKLLKETLTYLSKRTEDHISKDENEKLLKADIIYKKICTCVDHYDNIFEYVCNLEEIYSSTIFSQFLGSVVVICISCFLLSVLPPISVQFFAVGSFMISILTQLFLTCYAGTLLYDEIIRRSYSLLAVLKNY